jgi:hypothetical protein
VRCGAGASRREGPMLRTQPPVAFAELLVMLERAGAPKFVARIRQDA